MYTDTDTDTDADADTHSHRHRHRHTRPSLAYTCDNAPRATICSPAGPIRDMGGCDIDLEGGE